MTILAIDALTLYVNAHSLEVSLAGRRLGQSDDTWVVGREEILRRFAALPETFPNTKRYAAELTAGTPRTASASPSASCSTGPLS
jgi:hypothetical protein